MLKSVNIKEVYDSEEDNILEEFYIPTLRHAVRYDRSVGYFDAKVLTTAARGLSSFLDNGGKIRLIVGATLTEDEYVAIQKGYDERVVEKLKTRLEGELAHSIERLDSDLLSNQLNTLSWMIKYGHLDIKIALRRGGIYHEKIGIITDQNGDSIVFQGSANETVSALASYNHESINVFKSWLPEFAGHISPHVNKFEALWNDCAKNTKVLKISDITYRAISKKTEGVKRPDIKTEIELWQKELEIGESNSESNLPKVPQLLFGKPFKLKDHQLEALNAWKGNGFKGIFELATGAGKTITAIYGAVRIFENRRRLFLVISAPYQSLADQWVENLALFNITPIVCYGGVNKWRDKLCESVSNFKLGLIDFVAVVVVDATLASKSKEFANIIDDFSSSLEKYFLFIGDECHHHGSPMTASALPKTSSMRIGLSATPDRGDEDAEGNLSLYNYYGKSVAEYSLEDALNDDVLTPYKYHIVDVELTAEETEHYIELSNRISKLVAVGSSIGADANENQGSNSLNILLNKRARLINGTQNKPLALRKLISGWEPIKHSLFYCAEGRLRDGTDTDDQLALKQVEKISEVLHELGWKSSQFTANENKLQRTRILESFKAANIDSLVAMKCLDEGIDIPACSTAFILASTRQPRQFIQRRGRILRKSEGKSISVIYDFFVKLPIDVEVNEKLERKLLISELRRMNEFASLAINKGETYQKLKPYLTKHDLLHYMT